MGLTLLDAGAVQAGAENELGGEGVPLEGVAELVRREVHARGMAPRAATLGRVRTLMAGALELDAEGVNAACERLVREGDLVLAPGGVLAATPLRVVVLTTGRARVFSSLPTGALEARLGVEATRDGVARWVPWVEGMTARVEAMGGVVVATERWTGLDRAPHADDVFLERLDERLTWEGLEKGALEGDGPIQWRALMVAKEGPRWGGKDGVVSGLWRARRATGGWDWAWTSGVGSPAAARFVTVTGDEASRAVFALARRSGSPVRAEVEVEGDEARMTLPVRLPRAEYRYLVLQAAALEPAPGAYPWGMPTASVEPVLALVLDRLGVVVAGDEPEPPEGDGTDDDPDDGEGGTSGDEAVGEASHPELDEPLPELSHMGPLFERLRLTTYRDLLPLEIDGLRNLSGVGRKKVRVLRELRSTALEIMGADGPESEEDVVPEPVDSPYDDLPPDQVLGRLSARERGVLERFEIATIGALRAWLPTARPGSVENFGRRSRDALRERLDALLESGSDDLVFGGPAPQTVHELAGAYLRHLSPEKQEVFQERFVDGKTLEQVGQPRGITRERVRQVVETELALDRPSWGPRAQELLDPLLRVLDEAGGIAPTRRCLAAIAEPPLWAIEVCAALAAVDDVRMEVDPSISTALAHSEFVTFRQDLRAELREWLDGHLELDGLLSIVKDAGLRWPEPDVREVAESWLGVRIDGNKAFLARRPTVATYVNVLHEAGCPLTAAEVAERVRDVDPDLEPSARNAVATFSRTEQVFSYSHGTWIHAACLPFAVEVISDAAQRCMPAIMAADGAAVSARLLLDGLRHEGAVPEGVTPYLLRDAILRTGKARGWRAGTDVAWKDGTISRKSVNAWISEVATDLDQPFAMNDLVGEVAAASGYEPGSIHFQAQTTRSLLGRGDGWFFAAARLFETPEALDEARDLLASRLEPIISSPEKLAKDCPELEPLVTAYGTEVLFAIIRGHSEVVTRIRGRMAWPASLGPHVWDVLHSLPTGLPDVFSAKDLTWSLRAAGGVTGEMIAHHLIAEGVEAGYVTRIGRGWYLNATHPFELQVDCLDLKPEIVRLALGSQDFVRESPARELLNELRVRHHSFRVPA